MFCLILFFVGGYCILLLFRFCELRCVVCVCVLCVFSLFVVWFGVDCVRFFLFYDLLCCMLVGCFFVFWFCCCHVFAYGGFCLCWVCGFVCLYSVLFLFVLWLCLLVVLFVVLLWFDVFCLLSDCLLIACSLFRVVCCCI